MAQNIAELTEKMHAYFKNCKDKATIGGDKKNKPVASEAGMCVELGITKDELRAMEQGNDEERRFFGKYQLEYEVAVDVMRNAYLISEAVYKELKSGFNKSSTSEDKTIVLQFPDWNAPEDWEDYKELRELCGQRGITLQEAAAIVRKTAKGTQS